MRKELPSDSRSSLLQIVNSRETLAQTAGLNFLLPPQTVDEIWESLFFKVVYLEKFLLRLCGSSVLFSSRDTLCVSLTE